MTTLIYLVDYLDYAAEVVPNPVHARMSSPSATMLIPASSTLGTTRFVYGGAIDWSLQEQPRPFILRRRRRLDLHQLPSRTVYG
jgi:hypothetical protein